MTFAHTVASHAEISAAILDSRAAAVAPPFQIRKKFFRTSPASAARARVAAIRLSCQSRSSHTLVAAGVIQAHLCHFFHK
jgi:hypothetical protein